MKPHVRVKSRRTFLGLMAAGGAAAQSSAPAKPGQPLTDQDKIDVGQRGPEMIQRASALGAENFKQWSNCAQATIGAVQDALEFVPKNGDVFLTGSCLHGAATATGNASCGAFTGAGIVIGHVCGRTRARASEREAQKLATALVRQVAGKFEEAYGSVICKDVRAKVEKKCAEVVARASSWTAEVILKQFAKSEKV
ncbi:MAG: C_GCAxxG_C_C family protein [Acidobacteria bacterium]|nr:C_GCAxxG_C_C family protein [Acidobacteriota bacterium]